MKTYIKQKMNVTRSLLDYIKTKQLQLYGHVERMVEVRYKKNKCEPKGRKNGGKPKLIWMYEIQNMME